MATMEKSSYLLEGLRDKVAAQLSNTLRQEAEDFELKTGSYRTKALKNIEMRARQNTLSVARSKSVNPSSKREPSPDFKKRMLDPFLKVKEAQQFNPKEALLQIR
jgi:hypothetical protein